MEKIKIDKWDARIGFDEVEKVYIVCFDGSLGAIVTDADPIEAEKKFAKAMQYGESLSKLIYFEEHGCFPPENKTNLNND